MFTLTSRFGYTSALLAFLAAAGYCIVQLLQVFGWMPYPYDEFLIYGFSLFIAIPYMLAIMALHREIKDDKKTWTHAALLTATLYAVYATLVYVVQLAMVVPQSLRGDAEDIGVLVMYQHSLFWTLDALTYIMLGLSTFFAAFAFEKNGEDKWLRNFLLANAVITPLIAFVYFYPNFSTGLLFLGSPWIITAPGSMWLLSRYFRRLRIENKPVIRFRSAELIEILE
ncbi:MAG: hypothetical protein ACO1OO_12550 [Flavisolibacter sp.]